MSTNIADKENGLSFGEFPLPDKGAWRAEAEATLAGAPFEKKLITKTPEGIDIQPIYQREDLEGIEHLGSLPGEAPYVRGTRATNTWEVAQEIAAASQAEYNEALRHDLERGQTAVALNLNDVYVETSADFGRILNGVDAARVPLFLEGCAEPKAVFAGLLSYLAENGKNPARLRGAIACDPLGGLVANGNLPKSHGEAFDDMAEITRLAAKETPEFRTIGVSTSVYHDAGATAVQELAYALATGVEYLREMESRGIEPDTAAAKMRFTFSIGSDLFMAIAKFRAARMLWSRAVAASGGGAEAQKMRIHARTSLWNKTKLDPHVNMLRDTTEAFAAVAGGCESLHVGAFDEVIRTPDEFSRREARNTQIILRDECHFDQVIDPAGGSYYAETLTSRLAEKAWAAFQEIEKLGGMTKALAAGVPQKAVNAAAESKLDAVAQRRSSVIGVNIYANPKELLTACHSAPDGMGAGGKCSVPPLHPLRVSGQFERLRAAVEAAGKPKVFLANMGPLRQHKARADFSTSFFQTGGFDVLENRGFKTVAEAVAEAQKSGAQVFVICSTDETYPELVPPFAGLIKASQPKSTVIVAGYPKEHIEAFKAAGVDEFIHIRANCYETLRGLAVKLGIQL